MTFTILDGGMGQELIARNNRPPTPLWGTQVLLDAPEIVRAVHDDYFAAGAGIATANSYALHHDRLDHRGFGGDFRRLHELACSIATEARDAHGSGLVAGALGPLSTSYRPDLAPPPEEAAELYAEICAIQAPLVDFFICETMSSVEQARGALMGAQPFGKPVWLALSVLDEDGTRLRSGEPINDIQPLLQEMAPEAVLLNCSTPEAVSQGLQTLTDPGRPVGAYANGFTMITEAYNKPGTTVDLLEARQDLTPDAYADFAVAWAGEGATILGGCCEVGPAHIRAMSARLKGTN